MGLIAHSGSTESERLRSLCLSTPTVLHQGQWKSREKQKMKIKNYELKVRGRANPKEVKELPQVSSKDGKAQSSGQRKTDRTNSQN